MSLLPACFRRRLGFRPRERRPRRRLGERQPFGAVSGVQGHGLETVRPVRGTGVNQDDLFGGKFLKGDTCWLCSGKAKTMCGNCVGLTDSF